MQCGCRERRYLQSGPATSMFELSQFCLRIWRSSLRGSRDSACPIFFCSSCTACTMAPQERFGGGRMMLSFIPLASLNLLFHHDG
jgi:hypothetical protein